MSGSELRRASGRSEEGDAELESLLTDLADWAPPMRPVDVRALSDRVLRACGWVKIAVPMAGANRTADGWGAPDDSLGMQFLGGQQPHPLMSLDDALSILPAGWMVVEMRLLDHPRLWLAQAVHVTRGQRIAPMHACLSIAVATAAVLAWAEKKHRA